MEGINQDAQDSTQESMSRLEAAATLLEKTIAWLEERQAEMAGDVQKIVATVEQSGECSRREHELEKRLAEAETQIAELKSQNIPVAAAASTARRTLPAATVQLLSKQGIEDLDRVDASSLDAALTGLSLEQRIAVKSQLLRAGSLG
jgi:predicted RNase H-like nuclease (RuvC/YqgF family)